MRGEARINKAEWLAALHRIRAEDKASADAAPATLRENEKETHMIIAGPATPETEKADRDRRELEGLIRRIAREEIKADRDRREAEAKAAYEADAPRRARKSAEIDAIFRAAFGE